MNISLDDLQEEKYIKPIFDSLIKNADDKLIKQIFLDIGIENYFNFLPEHIKNDDVFIKQCISNNLLPLKILPEKYLNKNFISQNEYIENSLKFGFLTNDIYPQNEEIVFKILSKNSILYHSINEELKQNSSLMVEVFKNNETIFRYLPFEIKEEILKDKELIIKTLEKKPFFYNDLPINFVDDEILLTMLKKDCVDRVGDKIKETQNQEIALLALSYGDRYRKYLHPIYQTILGKNKIKSNCFDFLKAHLEKQNLNKEIENKKDTNSVKNKI